MLNKFDSIIETYMCEGSRNYPVVSVERVSGTHIKLDGKEIAIPDWIYGLTDLGAHFFGLSVKRRNDKKVKGVLVAKAGDIVKYPECRYGGSKRDITTGTGSPVGTSKDGYQNHSLMRVNAKRPDRPSRTTNVAVDGIVEVVAGGVKYELV